MSWFHFITSKEGAVTPATDAQETSYVWVPSMGSIFSYPLFSFPILLFIQHTHTWPNAKDVECLQCFQCLL